MSTSLFLVALCALAVAWPVSKWAAQRQPQLPANIPYVKIKDADDSYQRHFDDTRAVATDGYNKVRCS